MQKRHTDRYAYFQELAQSSSVHFLPYIEEHWHRVESGMHILEIGCGDGGNLLPFAEKGCITMGIDISSGRIKDAKTFFKKHGLSGNFIAADFLQMEKYDPIFDIILCHDVLEHIDNKEQFLQRIYQSLKPAGIIFMAFPAWQMPFGGHQQLCRNKFLSKLPFIHLFPSCLYKGVLKLFNESESCQSGLLSIKQTGISIESFEKLIKQMHLKIVHRQLWFINPHYQTKFGLRPLKLVRPFAHIPYLRDFMTTSCCYLLNQVESGN